LKRHGFKKVAGMTPIQIKDNGEMMDVTPYNGSHFTMFELYRLTESEQVELISFSYELVIVVDQQAQRKGKPVNKLATAVAFGILANGDHLAGAVLICAPSQVVLESINAASA
jgi:hypothetical protein